LSSDIGSPRRLERVGKKGIRLEPLKTPGAAPGIKDRFCEAVYAAFPTVRPTVTRSIGN